MSRLHQSVRPLDCACCFSCGRYTDASSLVCDPEVEAVYVASPPESHRDLALLCLQHRKPCLVEKPM